MDFRKHTVADLAESVREGEVSARELTTAALQRIDHLDGELGAFVALDPEGALDDAAAVDERVAAGDPVGPLVDLVGIKDLDDVAGFVTTHGSPIHEDDPPAARDSILVGRLRAAGCVVVGKTNTPEFGHRADTTNPVFGATRNPWDVSRSPGGSSGGTGAALASGMVPLATGSDGGGSIRIPSAVCGFTAIKTCLGRVPAGGPTPPNWHDLSVKGPMTRRIRDAALALDAVVGPEPTDLASLPRPAEPWFPQLHEPQPLTRVAWSPTLGYARVDTEIRQVCEDAVRALEATGVEVVEVEGVWDEDPVGVWLTLAASYNRRSIEDHRDTDLWDRFDPLLTAAVDFASAGVGPMELIAAQEAAHRYNVALQAVLAEVDVLLCPTVVGQTPRSGEQGTVDGEPLENWVGLTYGFNLTRSPAGSVRAGFTADGMPVGLQVVGGQHDDLGVLRTLAVLEDLLGIDPVAPVG
ncbi:MAG: amidase [Acidimicrobiia bacterium]|nr:amidase [Acidimicrobiia bacterium]